MNPSSQVKAGSSGLIVNAAHLTLAGADRVAKIVTRYADRSRVSHRLGFNASNGVDLTPGAAVDVEFRAAFGTPPDFSKTLPPTLVPLLGFVDLRRIAVAEATEHATAASSSSSSSSSSAGAGSSPLGGVLVTVTADGVRLLPPPRAARLLPEHLDSELGPDAPSRPAVDLLLRLAAPMHADARRINGVIVPRHLALTAAEEWAGAAARHELAAVADAYSAWAGTEVDYEDLASSRAHFAARPPMPLIHIGALPMFLVDGDTDEVVIMSAKGPYLADQQWSEKIPTLAANVDWAGPASEQEQQAYARLRSEGLDPADAVAVLPDVLSR